VLEFGISELEFLIRAFVAKNFPLSTPISSPTPVISIQLEFAPEAFGFRISRINKKSRTVPGFVFLFIGILKN
jgi:hypothetical protein